MYTHTTILTEPLLRQLLLVDAVQMEPLSLAVTVLTHYHLSEGWSAAIAILGLVLLVDPFSLAFLALFINILMLLFFGTVVFVARVLLQLPV